jgi:hypothetical protein
MDIVTVTAVVGTGITVVGAVVITARYAARHVRDLTREMAQWREDWYGEKARPGFAAIPGIPERLQRIEYQISSNGGGSMKDAINRVELNQSRQAVDHGILVRRVDAYISQMAPAIAELVEWQRWRNAIPADPDPDAPTS